MSLFRAFMGGANGRLQEEAYGKARTFPLVVGVLVMGAKVLRAESSDLPGPGLDIAVDLDGDGISTHGDRYAFNYWLLLGGDLETALMAAEAGKDGVIDLSKFFRSSAGLLSSSFSPFCWLD
jgi:hypothetical protein